MQGPGELTAAGPTVRVMYTCHACGITKREVEVPERVAGSDVAEWVRTAGTLCGISHMLANPFCGSEQVDLWIPLPGGANDYIGKAKRQ